MPTVGRKNLRGDTKEKIAMTKQFRKDAFLWGFILWLIGYLLGIILFMAVPHTLIGWILTPIGILITLWVLIKKVKANSYHYFVLLALVWFFIAVICDYIFLVRIFKPADGYYKMDVYLYYALTLILPLLVGWKRGMRK